MFKLIVTTVEIIFCAPQPGALSRIFSRQSTLIATLLVLQFTVSISAQELPPILNYGPDIYEAGSQNWMIAQAENQFIYVANDQGLLEFNGSSWSHYPSPNETVMRSVLPAKGRIYSGCYMEFGYWQRNEIGLLEYQSLSDLVAGRLFPDEQFWNIIQFGDLIVFQSLQQLILYDPAKKSLDFIKPADGVFKLHATGGSLYFSDPNNRVFRLEQGIVSPLGGGKAFASLLIHVWWEEGVLYGQTATDGCFRIEDDKLVKTERFPFLIGKKVYSGKSLQDGGLAFGTVSDGVFLLLNESDEVSYHLYQVNGLINNTVLALFEDTENNIWLATDNGVSCINVNAPFREFTDRTGRLGTVYAAAIHRGDLYLGSNQGLFVKRLNSEEKLELVAGTQGQVWALSVIDDHLFCGHSDGSFLINSRKATKIFDQSGTWLFQSIPGRVDLILQGNYYGVSVLEKKNGRWSFRNKLSGFDYSGRYLAVTAPREVYLSHEYRGVYGLKIDEDYRTVVEQKLFDQPRKGKNAGLVEFGGTVYYLAKAGIFKLDDFSSGFVLDTSLNNSLFPADYLSGKMIATDQRLWFFDQQRLSFFQLDALSSGLKRQTVSVNNRLLNTKSGYENVLAIARDTVLIGTADGYLLLAVDAITLPRHEVHLNAVVYGQGKRLVLDVEAEQAKATLPPRQHKLSFEFSVPTYSKFLRPKFQYRFVDGDSSWSDWTEEGGLTLVDLDYGSYELEARSMVGRRLSENKIVYNFVVARPWILSFPGLIFLGLGAIFFIGSLHRAYTNYYRKQRKELEARNNRMIAAQQRETELALSNLRNEQLKKDIESKSQEMAASMMSLVKKNELLQEIKSILELKRPAQQNIKEVLNIIDASLDGAENWNLFEEAFNHADRDFFQRIKEKHSKLTSNDLKLCAYLRLSLSSKEIAPLLNISLRSVEVKRYRLRKKLDLDHEVGLVDYIVSI